MSIDQSGALATQEPPTPIFVGLDLSLTSTGFAVIHGGTATVQRITSKPPKLRTSEGQAERLQDLVAEIYTALPISDHTHVAIEGPSYGSTGGSAHERGGLWWMVRSTLRDIGLDVIIAAPGTVKKYATGKGNSPKDAVLAAVIRRYPDVNITGNDEADALTLAAICARFHGHPFEDLPAMNTSAVSAVTR